MLQEVSKNTSFGDQKNIIYIRIWLILQSLCDIFRTKKSTVF